jgi:hypothetical protein
VIDSIDESSNESGDEDGEAKDDAGEDDIFKNTDSPKVKKVEKKD